MNPAETSLPAADYEVDELMIAVISSYFRDGEQVANGMASFIPVSALMLARLTHAPKLVWLAGSLGVEPRPDRLPASTLESPLWRDSVMYLEQFGDFWNYACNEHRIRKFCVGAAQIDRFGNANNSVIGDDYHRPKVRLPGTAGLGDMGSLNKLLYFWQPNHNPRALVERVDFVSCAGYLEGGDARERLGLSGGPQVVVTNLGVLDFDPVTKAMRIKSVHPGVTVDDVQDATGFELLVPDGDVPETTPPTAEQVRLIREVIDPDEIRKRELARR